MEGEPETHILKLVIGYWVSIMLEFYLCEENERPWPMQTVKQGRHVLIGREMTS